MIRYMSNGVPCPAMTKKRSRRTWPQLPLNYQLSILNYLKAFSLSPLPESAKSFM